MITATPDSAKPWMYTLRGPELRTLKEWAYRELIGFAWYGPGQGYLVAREMLVFLENYCKSRGVEFVVSNPTTGVVDASVAAPLPAPGLHEYQITGIERAVLDGRGRWIFADETGLGKSAQALLTAKHYGCSKILIVGPAISKFPWKAQIETWWPERAPEVGVISLGRDVKNLSKPGKVRLETTYKSPIQIISYGLLANIANTDYDAIILDECHALKNPTSQQSLEVARIVNTQKYLKCLLGCSATLVPDKPVDVWGPVSAIWPGRFGPPQRNGKPNFKFCERYTNAVHTEYGWKYPGVNEHYKEELAWRLRGLSSRTTKAEVAHLLPAFMVKTVQSGHHDKHRAIREWFEQAQETATHICIATYYRRTAEYCAAELAKHTDRTVFHIDGSLPPDRRAAILGAAKNAPAALIVTTIPAVAESLDLTFCTEALVVEIPQYVKLIMQFLGRFSRLCGKLPSAVSILLCTSRDQIRAMQLEDKIAAINAVIKAGKTEQALAEITLAGDEKTWLSDLGSEISDVEDELKELL